MSSAKKLVIFGLARFAERVTYYFDQSPDWEVVAFAVDRDRSGAETFMGRPVVGTEVLAQGFPPEEHAVFVAVGYSAGNRGRAEVSARLGALGYPLASYIHATAAVHASPLGPGAFLADHAIVGPYAEVGAGAVLSVGTCLSHHSRIGDHCYLSAGAIVAGESQIGDRVFIGAGARIADGLTIASDVVIGMGACVLNDITEPGTYVGTPARRIAQSAARIGS